jgi:hypothetical protein
MQHKQIIISLHLTVREELYQIQQLIVCKLLYKNNYFFLMV